MTTQTTSHKGDPRGVVTPVSQDDANCGVHTEQVRNDVVGDQDNRHADDNKLSGTTHITPFKITRLSEYSTGRAGMLEVTAKTLKDLLLGIEEVLRQYPKKPYGTVIRQGRLGDNGTTWSAFIEHFGAD